VTKTPSPEEVREFLKDIDAREKSNYKFEILDPEDLKALSRKSPNLTRFSPDDILLKETSVYRLGLIMEHKAILTTTNEDLGSEQAAWVNRRTMRLEGFAKCPLELRSPAVQIFELDSKFNDQSLDQLSTWRKSHQDWYDRFQLDVMFSDLPEKRHFEVPLEMSAKYPKLEGKKFDIPIAFRCITKSQFKKLFRSKYRNDQSKSYLYDDAMRYSRWPVIFVPQRYS